MARLLAALLLVLASLLPAQGQDNAAYSAAAKSFSALKPEQRFNDQILLVAAGFLQSPISADYTPQLHAAIMAFQAGNDWPQNGQLSDEQRQDVADAAFPFMLRLGFRQMVEPKEKLGVWVPAGFRPVPDKNGITWGSASRGAGISFAYFPQGNLAGIRTHAQARAKAMDGRIENEIRGKKRYDARATGANGEVELTNFATYKSGIAGTLMKWRRSDANADMDRAAIIVAGSVTASLAKLPFPAPHTFPEGLAEHYDAAARTFAQLSISARMTRQIELVAAGYLTGDLSSDYTPAVHEAQMAFQAAFDRPVTGILDEAEQAGLTSIAEDNLMTWGFIQLGHPQEDRPIWVPAGLDPEARTLDRGLQLTSAKAATSLAYVFAPDVDLTAVYAAELADHESKARTVLKASRRENRYQLLVEDAEGMRVFSQYHRHGNGVMGIKVAWRPRPGIAMDRMVELVSASLTAAMSGAAFPAPPEFAEGEGKAPSAEGDGPGMSFGTGFFIDGQGHILTNAHVIESCTAIIARNDAGDAEAATILVRDEANDLALLKTPFRPEAFARFRTAVRVGENAAAFGFPLPDLLSMSGNFTTGNITALSGMRDDSRFNQMSVPVQPGNSGGPMVDYGGNVIGVVTLKLNALAVMKENGDIPQNVNFALKSSLAASFAEDNGLTPTYGELETSMTPVALAEAVRTFSAFIMCQQ
jgi:S1-C subfamily serine protease